MKITLDNLKFISNRIIEKLVLGELTYFNLTVADSSGFSSCYFSATSQANINGRQKTMCFVGDYEKIICMLLSHPNISELQYFENENCVSCVFDNPYREELEEIDREEYNLNPSDII